MKTCGIKGLLNILSTYGSVTLYCIMFTYQGEELNHQHFLLGIASTTLLCEALLIAYVRKHKFDIIDVSIFVAYLYFIFMNEYNNALSDKSDIYSVQLFFVLYFAFRIILHCFHVKYILICLLAVTEIFQSLVGTGQFLGILDSRHTSFSVTGTFLNPGPFWNFFSLYLELLWFCILSPIILYLPYIESKDTQYDKTAMLFFQASYYLSLIASIFIIIMLVLSGSRSALLGFGIPIAIFILTTRRIRNRINYLRHKKSFTCYRGISHLNYYGNRLLYSTRVS